MSTLWISICAVVAVVAVSAAIEIHQDGKRSGVAQCEATQAKAVQSAEAEVKTEAQTVIARATSTGHQREQSRQRIATVFTQLATEADHEKPDPVDSCVLPASRLRIWRAANSGDADSGAAPGQPIDATAAPATAPVGPAASIGGEPPGGSPGLPPASGADVQPVDLSTD